MSRKLLIAFVFAVMVCTGQTARSVQVVWTPATNPVGTGFNVFRYVGTPSQGLPYTKINTVPITTSTYMDTAVVPGTTYTYAVTATLNGVDSAYSTPAVAVIPQNLNPPTNLQTTVATITVNVVITGPTTVGASNFVAPAASISAKVVRAEKE